MHTQCAHFPVAGLGLRRSVSGPQCRTGSGAGYQVSGTRFQGAGIRYLEPGTWDRIPEWKARTQA